MLYCGTYNTEDIVVHIDGDHDDVHVISLIKEANKAVFTVKVCCYEDWEWKFSLDSATNYEMIKYTIMDVIFACDDMDELIKWLDIIFEKDFSNIVVDENECDNECCCENCNHRDCLN